MQISYDYHNEHKRFKRKTLPQGSAMKNVPSKKSKRGGFFSLKRVVLFVLGCFVLGSIAFVGMIGWYSRNLPNPNRLIERSLPQSTRIYDRTEKVLLYEFHGNQQRTLVSLEEIPEHLKNAAIISEDKNFYQHKGFDLKGIIRALVVDVLRGGKVQGGSTITQQLIKNALLSNEKSISRKLKELVLAYQIEKRFTKDQILQMYFNEIPYGSTAYGIRAASYTYFDKDVRDLSLAESAILAVLPRAPTYYSPWGSHRDELIAAQRALLDSMVAEGVTSDIEAQDAKKETLAFREQRNSLRAPHFVMYIREILTDLYGEKLVEEGGLSVITTLDYDKQKIAEDVTAEWGKKNESMGARNAALVSLDARTGEILAMVGSKDYYDESIDGNVNVVLRPRQPGSSFKPIVYAAAFQKGYTPSTILFDLKINFDTTGQKPYEPENYSQKENGPVTMKKALAGSLNIPAVKTLYLVGVAQAVEFAKNLGYSTLQDPYRYGLSLVLGGGEVTLLEHAAAYTTFAQEGVRAQPAGILRVQDQRGNVLQEFQKKTVKTVLDPESARNITDILSDNAARSYIFGASNYLQLKGREAAAKTGTTNDFHDAWTIGYTPSVVTGVWVGNNDNSPMKKGADGSKLAAPIWRDYMQKTLSGVTGESFTRPLSVAAGKGILDGVIGQEIRTRYDAATGELASEQTPLDRIQEKVTRQIHDTLFYVDKNNPRGPLPSNPEQDPQFGEWERAARRWVDKTKTPEDGSSVEGAGATPLQTFAISIDSPQENDTISNPQLPISVSSVSAAGIIKVEYFIDSKILGTTTSSPHFLTADLSKISDGFRTIRVRAFDKTGKTADALLTINLLIKK
jgi:1A family penicillin-binding protein